MWWVNVFFTKRFKDVKFFFKQIKNIKCIFSYDLSEHLMYFLKMYIKKKYLIYFT